MRKSTDAGTPLNPSGTKTSCRKGVSSRIAGRLAIALAALALATPALADRRPPPGPATYHSADRATRLAVTPDVDRLVDNRGGAATARGRLERRGAGGRWTTVWTKPLVNDTGPVSALVANGGTHVVTFDEWFARGTGPAVVAIYRADGSLVRTLALADLIPAAHIAALPRTVSSREWAGRHRLSPDERHVIVQVRRPGPGGGYLERAITLADGRPVAALR